MKANKLPSPMKHNEAKDGEEDGQSRSRHRQFLQQTHLAVEGKVNGEELSCDLWHRLEDDLAQFQAG